MMVYLTESQLRILRDSFDARLRELKSTDPGNASEMFQIELLRTWCDRALESYI